MSQRPNSEDGLRARHVTNRDRQARIITFSGIDGSGKSTQIELLRVGLTDAGLRVAQLAFWDNVVAFSRMRAGFSHKYLQSEGGVGSPEKPVNRNDKNKRTWYLTIGRSGLYLIDALRLRKAVAAAKASDADVIIFDRYIYDQLATLPLHRWWARAFARLILSIVPKPDLSYLLDAEPEVARARKPEYPIDFMHQYRASYLCLSDLGKLSLIPPMSKDQVQEAIAARLESTFSLRLPRGLASA